MFSKAELITIPMFPGPVVTSIIIIMALTFSLTQMFLDQLQEFILLCQTSPEVLQRKELTFFLDFCSSWSQIQKFREESKVNGDSSQSTVNINVFPKLEDKKAGSQEEGYNDEDYKFGFQVDAAKNYLDVVVKEEDGDATGHQMNHEIFGNRSDDDYYYGEEDEEEEEERRRRKPKKPKIKKVKKEKIPKEKRVKKVKKEDGGTSSSSKNHQCPECGDILSSTGALVLHIKAKHEGVKYPCPQCDAVYTTMGNLKVHISSKHEGKRFQCEYCEYQPTKKLLLTKHIKAKHLGIKVKCDLCNYETSKKENLRMHVRSVHEGLRFTCEHCGYQAMRQENLRAHIRDLHENLTFFCNKCQFQTNRKRKIHEHLRGNHADCVAEADNNLNHPNLLTIVKNSPVPANATNSNVTTSGVTVNVTPNIATVPVN